MFLSLSRAHVLYDRPPAHFKRITIKQQHQVSVHVCVRTYVLYNNNHHTQF